MTLAGCYTCLLTLSLRMISHRPRLCWRELATRTQRWSGLKTLSVKAACYCRCYWASPSSSCLIERRSRTSAQLKIRTGNSINQSILTLSLVKLWSLVNPNLLQNWSLADSVLRILCTYYVQLLHSFASRAAEDGNVVLE